MNRLRKFLDLPRDERRLLLAALCGLPLVSAGIYLLGYKRMRALLAGKEAPSKRRSQSLRAEAERVARAVRVAARHGPVRGSCLSRAVLLWRMLDRRRIPAEIRFGARAGGAAVEAHAWIEQDGRALDDDLGQQLFADLEPARRRGPAAP